MPLLNVKTNSLVSQWRITAVLVTEADSTLQLSSSEMKRVQHKCKKNLIYEQWTLKNQRHTNFGIYNLKKKVQTNAFLHPGIELFHLYNLKDELLKKKPLKCFFEVTGYFFFFSFLTLSNFLWPQRFMWLDVPKKVFKNNDSNHK